MIVVNRGGGTNVVVVNDYGGPVYREDIIVVDNGFAGPAY